MLKRLQLALSWLVEHRTDRTTSLLWGATTLDWGDVQPEPDLHDPRLLENGTHPAIDVYDNSMFVMAIQAFVELAELVEAADINTTHWRQLLNSTRVAIRTHLWTGTKFIPHLYMDDDAASEAAAMAGLASFRSGSPFDASFNESQLSYHGGTACAAMAGLLTEDEMRGVLHTQLADVQAVNDAGGDVTIGLTIYPPYPNVDVMKAWTYQNGSDWSWFGGRMVSALVSYGYLTEAASVLAPMVNRVVQHNGFFEWWAKDGTPSGSSLFHGAAGVLGTAIVELQQAMQQAHL